MVITALPYKAFQMLLWPFSSVPHAIAVGKNANRLPDGSHTKDHKRIDLRIDGVFTLFEC